ncbi:MAG: hypothetical protein ABIZ80_17685 [Bryobacteraceae bacterium]
MTLRDIALGLAFAGLLTGSLGAQQSSGRTSTTSIDVNGRRVENAGYSSVEGPGGSRSEVTVRSINGRNVPMQSVEERVLEQNSQGKVVERVVRKYDANGSPAATETVRVEERKNPDGSSTIRSTTYHADVNGRPQLTERATTQVRKGQAAESTTVVERATLNGSLETVEKATSVERPEGGGKRQESTTFRRDVSGNFSPALQEVKLTTKRGNEETSDVTVYEALQSGKLEVARREVGKTKKNPDGSETEEVDVYSRFSASRSGDANASAPRLQEQILRQRIPGAGHSVVETTSVRARLPNDPSRFGTFEKVAQTTTTSTDASGREVKTSERTVSRRDANGEIGARDVERATTVKSK